MSPYGSTMGIDMTITQSPQIYQVMDPRTGQIMRFSSAIKESYYQDYYNRYYQQQSAYSYQYAQTCSNMPSCAPEPESKEDKLRRERKSKLKGLIAHYYNRK